MHIISVTVLHSSFFHSTSSAHFLSFYFNFFLFSFLHMPSLIHYVLFSFFFPSFLSSSLLQRILSILPSLCHSLFFHSIHPFSIANYLAFISFSLHRKWRSYHTI